MAFRNDPFWQKISASKRGGKIYVKMPQSAVDSLLVEIEIALMFQEDLRAEVQPVTDALHKLVLDAEATKTFPVIFELSPAGAEAELALLERIDPQTSGGRFAEYKGALRGGLNGDPALDWIKRTQAPTTE